MKNYEQLHQTTWREPEGFTELDDAQRDRLRALLSSWDIPLSNK